MRCVSFAESSRREFHVTIRTAYTSALAALGIACSSSAFAGTVFIHAAYVPTVVYAPPRALPYAPPRPPYPVPVPVSVPVVPYVAVVPPPAHAIALPYGAVAVPVIVVR
jgi:hypothetical protein